MKFILKKAITAIIQAEARMVLRKYKPKIVAVTGSVGKTSAKDAIYTALGTSLYVRKSVKSFNSEIGVPLTILGCPNGWNNPLTWIKNMIEGLALVLFPNNYPKWLILEIGADRPGDIRKISKWIKPDVLVVTAFSRTPVHVEFFPSVEALVEEKRNLAFALKRDGVLILNNDDDQVLSFREASPEAKTFLYGFMEGSDLRASNDSIIYKKEADGREVPTGVTFKVNYKGNSLPIVINGSLGIQHIFPALSALAVGVSQGLNLVRMTEALDKHVPPRGRMKIIPGLKGSTIIDDTYNSSPVALNEALQTLGKIKKSGEGRKIAVLGDMLELGQYSVDEHKSAGEVSASICDLLFTVGVRARYFAEGAMNAGMDEAKILQFEDSRLAGKELELRLQAGDTVLIKGSQGTRMERAVLEVMAEPEKAGELLVRQDEEWLAKV